MGFCRSCKAEISFVKTQNGKLMPVEPKQITVITRYGKMVKGFVPHWPNCRGADAHRKRN